MVCSVTSNSVLSLHLVESRLTWPAVTREAVPVTRPDRGLHPRGTRELIHLPQVDGLETIQVLMRKYLIQQDELKWSREDIFS